VPIHRTASPCDEWDNRKAKASGHDFTSYRKCLLIGSGLNCTYSRHRLLKGKGSSRKDSDRWIEISGSQLTCLSYCFGAVLDFAAPEGMVDITFNNLSSSALFKLLAFANSVFASAVLPIARYSLASR